MIIIKGIDRLNKSFRHPVVTLGNFDGVHLGHQQILKRVKEESLRLHGEGMVITFDPHPLKVLSAEKVLSLLTPFHKKMSLIEIMGIDAVLCIEFSPFFSEISPAAFIKNILLEKIGMTKVIVGYNYHFGKGQKGNVQTLSDAGKRLHFEVEIIQPLKINRTLVSSSKIRDFIKKGTVESASILLGRDYSVEGKVIKGMQRGQTLGFPTANLELSECLYPKTGVYAVEIEFHTQRFKGLANIGSNPTFTSSDKPDKRNISIEVHLFNFNQDIYGETIEVFFKKRMRDEIRFESPSQLIQQIEKDIRYAQDNIFGI